ncbi:alpha/beta fold hydrolase [Pseudonocardia sp. MCCB 268]|nr:alpha/beta fold hydrolase [Pseudonocardia cytotoxica]
MLLIAPGRLRSTIAAWDKAPWNPVDHLADRYRVIAMDQRNAGSSVGEVPGTDGWSTYTADQLALLDHLGVDEFAVLGMCIGGSYIASLLWPPPGSDRAAVASAADRPGGQPAPLRGDVRRLAGRDRRRPPRASDDWASFRIHVRRWRDAVLGPRRG